MNWARRSVLNFCGLCVDKTLDENGVEDEQEEFEALHLPDTFYIPSLFLYFNDDLTVA